MQARHGTRSPQSDIKQPKWDKRSQMYLLIKTCKSIIITQWLLRVYNSKEMAGVGCWIASFKPNWPQCKLVELWETQKDRT